MGLSRAPHAALRPFVTLLWASEGFGTAQPSREHVLPSAAMHVAIRLDGPPLQLFDDATDAARELGHAVLGGARATYYAKAVGGTRCTVGAQLRPGAARALFGVGADALAHRHVRLDDLYGPAALRLRERLQSTPSLAARIDLLETFLTARLSANGAMHPAVIGALHHFAAGLGIRDSVAASGFSHRRFIALFEDAVGLTPKRYCRVQRFQSILAHANDSTRPWARLALDAGYADQSHFAREFRALAGVTPDAYRRQPRIHRNHVTIAAR